MKKRWDFAVTSLALGFEMFFCPVIGLPNAVIELRHKNTMKIPLRLKEKMAQPSLMAGHWRNVPLHCWAGSTREDQQISLQKLEEEKILLPKQ